MDCCLKPHKGSCTTKDDWVFFFWFQALERVNCCRQSAVMHVADQLHSPLRPIGSQRLHLSRKPFSTFFTYLTFKNYPEMVDSWLENLIDSNESQMTTLNATFDPFVGTLTTKNMTSCSSCRGGLLQTLGLREERWLWVIFSLRSCSLPLSLYFFCLSGQRSKEAKKQIK